MSELIINYAWILIQLAIGYNLVLPVLLFIIYSFTRATHYKQIPVEPGDYAIIVTAFEQTDLLHDTVNSILKLNYPHFVVYVVADNCDISSLQFNDTRVIVLKPETVLRSNTRSHLHAIKNFVRDHNRLTIVDSDNVVHPEYLNEIEKWFTKGFSAVQGYRQAKNLDTTFACLDAARDIYYHFYDGKVLFHLGSSATLAGSGMAFDTDLYKSFLENHDINGAGFDKVLQYTLVKQRLRIAFTPDAIIYDEKTAESDQLVNQRSRWIHTWFKYSNFGFSLIRQGVKSANWNQFLFGLTLLRPPLFLFLILSVFAFIINLFINPGMAIIWIAAIFVFLLGFALAFLKSVVDPKIYRSLTSIPTFVFYQILSLIKIKSLSKRPATTQHKARPLDSIPNN